MSFNVFRHSAAKGIYQKFIFDEKARVSISISEF